MNTILVIEDDWAVRELFRIEWASEVLNIVAIGEVDSVRENRRASNPNLVLLDIYRRGRPRWDVLVEIKEENPKLPVIRIDDYDDYGKDPRFILVRKNRRACFTGKEEKKERGEGNERKEKPLSFSRSPRWPIHKEQGGSFQ